MHGRLALLIAVMALLVSAAPAQAGWKTDRALAIAQNVWQPAEGEFALNFERADPRWPGGDAYAAWAWEGDYTIRLDATRGWPWPLLCERVIHEAGHVVGEEHSDDPDSVMYPWDTPIRTKGRVNGRRVVRWQGVDRRCRERGRPYMERHGLL